MDEIKKDKKEKLKLKLLQFETLKELKEDNEELPNDFPKCFKNDAIVKTVNSILLALRNKRNLIIIEIMKVD